MKQIRTYVMGLLLIAFLSPTFAQTSAYTPKVKRVLFVLDGSGSMKEDFGGQSKFEIAKDLLLKVSDSISRVNRNVQFGLRIFGHQSPRPAHDCEDTKLEVSFGAASALNFKPVLNKVTPQGWTPIAYSLFLATNDFPKDPNAQNAIILITDGLENCDGDPCASALILQEKRISLRPFIVGLGIGQKEGEAFFDCVGTFIDASNRTGFENAVNTVMSSALNNTTAQVNLMNLFEKPDETNVEMTFYDAFSGEVRYNFVHTMDERGIPDTLRLNPIGKYNLVVHTIPPKERKNIELIPGKHNIIAVDAPQGSLQLKIEGSVFSPIQCIVRREHNKEILNVQDFNTVQKYIVGGYDLEILTLPRMYRGIRIDQSKISTIEVPKAGTLSISTSEPYIVSIYETKVSKVHRVFEYKNLMGRENLDLLPGTYRIVYRPNEAKQASLTQEQLITITPGNMTRLIF